MDEIIINYVVKEHELLVNLTLIASDTLNNPLEGFPVPSQFSRISWLNRF